MNLSQFVKEKRSMARLTQIELAEKAGVGLRFVRDLEQGKETLRIDKINQVLQLFGFEIGPVEKKREYTLVTEPGEFHLKGSNIEVTIGKNK